MTVSEKVLSVSSAAGQYLHDHVNIYECGNVFALMNDVAGEYRAVPLSSRSDRRMINSRPLVRYLTEKCGCSLPIKLHAWLDGEIILFCKGSAGENIRFHDGFSLITDVFRFRYDNSVKIYGQRIIVSAALSGRLGDRVSAYRYGNMYAFFCDDNGTIQTTFRNEFGTRAVRSEVLINEMVKDIGKGPLYGVSVPNGVVFSEDNRIDRKPIPIRKFRRLELTDTAELDQAGNNK